MIQSNFEKFCFILFWKLFSFIYWNQIILEMKIKRSTDNQKLITSDNSKCMTQPETCRARNNISFILQFVILLVLINFILTSLAFFVQFRYFESKNNELELRLNSPSNNQGSEAHVRLKRQDDVANTNSTNDLDFLSDDAFGSSYTEDQVFTCWSKFYFNKLWFDWFALLKVEIIS